MLMQVHAYVLQELEQHAQLQVYTLAGCPWHTGAFIRPAKYLTNQPMQPSDWYPTCITYQPTYSSSKVGSHAYLVFLLQPSNHSVNR
jgi:hypothetical protein